MAFPASTLPQAGAFAQPCQLCTRRCLPKGSTLWRPSCARWWRCYADMAVPVAHDDDDRGSPSPNGCIPRRITFDASYSFPSPSALGPGSAPAYLLPRPSSRQKSPLLEASQSGSPPSSLAQPDMTVSPPPLGATLLAVTEATPPAMRRPAWSQRDFTFTKHLHTGYASEVYMVGGCSARTAGQAWVFRAVSVARM